ncbi:hypothetical protein ABZ835_34235 [Streptomyces sp. NPDC047461]|uniref:hypothetical protein n=1 Tax=Streptomyces sp. NPDC047461 TaxID=3155619 RepID=UPI0033E7FD25
MILPGGEAGLAAGVGLGGLGDREQYAATKAAPGPTDTPMQSAPGAPAPRPGRLSQ